MLLLTHNFNGEIAHICKRVYKQPFTWFSQLNLLVEFLEITVLKPALCNILQHENASTMMLDYLIEDNNLWPFFEEWNLNKRDLIFIKEMIAGCKNPENQVCCVCALLYVFFSHVLTSLLLKIKCFVGFSLRQYFS